MMLDGPTTSIREILNGIGSFMSTKIMPILVGLAILIFIGNIIVFIASSGNERKREQFRKYIVNALIAMFILISIWGIVGLGTSSLFGTKPFIPHLPTSDRR